MFSVWKQDALVRWLEPLQRIEEALRGKCAGDMKALTLEIANKAHVDLANVVTIAPKSLFSLYLMFPLPLHR